MLQVTLKRGPYAVVITERGNQKSAEIKHLISGKTFTISINREKSGFCDSRKKEKTAILSSAGLVRDYRYVDSSKIGDLSLKQGAVTIKEMFGPKFGRKLFRYLAGPTLLAKGMK